MHFAMHAFNNHAEVLHSVTPIDLLAQSAVLSDGVVVRVLHNVTYMGRNELNVLRLHDYNRPAPLNL